MIFCATISGNFNQRKIAVNRRAAQKDAEVCTRTSSRFLGNCLGDKAAESLHQSTVSQLTSQRANHDGPSLPQGFLLSLGRHPFVCRCSLLFFLSRQGHVNGEAFWTFVWDGENFLSIKSLLATGGTMLTDRGAWQDLAVHSEFYEKPIKKQTVEKKYRFYFRELYCLPRKTQRRSNRLNDWQFSYLISYFFFSSSSKS